MGSKISRVPSTDRKNRPVRTVPQTKWSDILVKIEGAHADVAGPVCLADMMIMMMMNLVRLLLQRSVDLRREVATTDRKGMMK